MVGIGPLARLVVRLALRVAVWAGWVLLSLALAAVGAWWVGVPAAVRIMAKDWMKRFAGPLLSSAYDPWLYHGAIVLAVLAVVAGWIVAAHLTVFLLGVIL